MSRLSIHYPLPVALCLAACLVALAAGCAAPSTTPPAPASPAGSHATAAAPAAPFNSELALRTFDEAWRIIHETHFDTSFNGVNWLALREELRPQAAAAQSNAALRSILEDMLQRLGQSHMSLIPQAAVDGAVARKIEAKSTQSNSAKTHESGQKRPKNPKSKPSRLPTPGDVKDTASAIKSGGDSSTPPKTATQANASNLDQSAEDSEEGNSRGEGDLGFDVRLIDDRPVVFRVDPDGPAGLRGIKPGWIVARIGNRSWTNLAFSASPDVTRLRFYAWAELSARLTGDPGKSVEIEFLDGQDRSQVQRITFRKNLGEPAKLGNLPVFYARLTDRWIESIPGVRAGHIWFNVWMIPVAPAFDRAVERYENADGIVIDLRGNLGGIGGMIMGISGHFLNESKSLGTFKTRGAELRLMANPRRVSASGRRVTPYAKPVAILTDAISLSAAEVFAGGMQELGRARVFGETSGGQALPATFDRLPNGDVLYHAFADFTTPAGVRLEKRGVIPDNTVPLTRPALLAGRDPALEAALQWIRDSRGTLLRSGP